MSEVSVTGMIEVCGMDSRDVDVLLVYRDEAGNKVGEQSVGMADCRKTVNSVIITTATFEPSIPDAAVKVDLHLRIRGYYSGLRQVLYLGRHDIAVLKQANPPFALRITVKPASQP